MVIKPESDPGHLSFHEKTCQVPSIHSLSVHSLWLERISSPRLPFSLAFSSHILLFSPTPQLVGSGWVPAVPRTPRGPILVIPQDHFKDGGVQGAELSGCQKPP